MSSQFNEQIIRGARKGIIVFGLDLRYQVWNPYMERLSGLAANEVLGKHPLEAFPLLEESVATRFLLKGSYLQLL